jgi:hypothetical protein
MTLVHYYNYDVFGHYPSSCRYLQTPSCLFFQNTKFRRLDPVSEILCFEKINRMAFLDKDRMMDNVQKT